MLTFIFWSIVIIWLIGWLMRFGVRYWLARQVQNLGGAGGQNSRRQNSRTTKKEGEITLETTEPTDKKVNKDVGEYVDFEEVPNND